MKSEMNFDIKVARRLDTTFSSAHRRNKEFNLDSLYLANILQQTHCAYSGVEFSPYGENGPNHMTLERIDNSIGYVKGNVIPVTHELNKMRGSFTMEELQNQRKTAEALMLRAAKAIDGAPTQDDLFNSMYKEQQDLVKTWRGHMANHDREISLSQNLIQGWQEEELKKNRPGSRDGAIKSEKSRIHKLQATKANVQLKIADYIAKHGIPGISAEAEFNNQKDKIEKLDILMAAIKRYESLTKIDKMKMSVGVSLDTSIIKVLKIKLAYNLVGGKL